jgi:hypothetical protein
MDVIVNRIIYVYCTVSHTALDHDFALLKRHRQTILKVIFLSNLVIMNVGDVAATGTEVTEAVAEGAARVSKYKTTSNPETLVTNEGINVTIFKGSIINLQV